jgi:hypothetical protein
MAVAGQASPTHACFNATPVAKHTTEEPQSGSEGGKGHHPGELCRFGFRCKRPNCWHEHPQGRYIDSNLQLAACRLGEACRKPDCFYGHPPGRAVRNKRMFDSPIFAPAIPPPAAEEAGDSCATEQLGSDRSTQKVRHTENTVFVGNLPCDITEEELTLISSTVGRLKQVRIHKHSAKVVYGFVEFTDPVHVELGLDLLNNALVLGRRLRVERCQRGPGGGRTRSRSRSHTSVPGPQTHTSSAPPKPSMAPHLVALKMAIAIPPQPQLPLFSAFPHVLPQHMLMPQHNLPMLQFRPVPLFFTMQAQTPTTTGLLAARPT